MLPSCVTPPTWRIIASLLAMLLIVALGIANISWQTSQGIHKDALERLNLALRQVDKTLDNAEVASAVVLPFAGKPCSVDVVQQLRYQVAIVPAVRTVNLARKKDIYCSSLYGAQQGVQDSGDYNDGQLYLMRGNPITPNQSLIAFRKRSGDNSVLVGINSYYLLNILELLSKHSELVVRIGNHWMSSDGKVHEGAVDLPGDILQLTSANYSFEVITAIQAASRWRHIMDYSLGSVILFPLLGMFVGVLTYVLLGRIGSPLSSLRTGITNDEFIPFLQPIVDGTNFHLAGCEVLIRWQHPQMGLVSPYNFIPLAEESGLIIPMTRALMNHVRVTLAPIADDLPDGFHVGFNISAKHCQDLSLIDECRTFITAFGQRRIRLILELTERELIVENDTTTRLFSGLRELGVLIAIDDFGTGHSSLSYLQQFHIDILKIDQSFIGKIGTDALSEHIVDNVIDLAKRLNMTVIAEGIETQAQVNYLVPFHLDFLQGYLFGKPMPAGDFIRSVQKVKVLPHFR